VKTLQLEQMAVTGSSEKPSVVASRMQLVFSTLEVYSGTVNMYALNKKDDMLVSDYFVCLLCR
jgi:hypothetical protein